MAWGMSFIGKFWLSLLRLVATLHDIQNIRGICKTSIKFDIEIEGQQLPTCADCRGNWS